MKKILFLFTFFIISFSQTPSAFAQTIFTSEEECRVAGGEQQAACNVRTDTCGDTQEKIGTCEWDGWLDNNSACCKTKDNGPVNPNPAPDDDLGDGSTKVIGTVLCQKSKSDGGWGGVCRDSSSSWDSGVLPRPWEFNPCNSSGDDEETMVGICNPTGDGLFAAGCCVLKGTEIQNPTTDQLYSNLVTSDYCSSTMGGKCEDIDDANFGETLRSLGVDVKDATCDTTNEVVASLCTDNSFFSSDTNSQINGCCVPKDGEYCKKLADDNGGNDICTTLGVGGTAQDIEYSDYELLEQIPGSNNTSGSLQPYLESLYYAGFVLIVLGAVIMIGFGGFTYMASAGNTSMIKKGKGMIADAIIGLVVALCIWLVLNIINPDLINLKIDPLPGLEFDSNGAGATTAANNTAGQSGSFTAKLYTGSDVSTDAVAREYLTRNGVGVNKSDCSSPGQTNCTSLGQWPASMAGIAKAIKQGCNCSVTVSGGTEAGHSTHGKGRAAMDVGKTKELDVFFSKLPKVGVSRGNPIYKYGTVKVWFEDSAHYHIWEPAN